MHEYEQAKKAINSKDINSLKNLLEQHPAILDIVYPYGSMLHYAVLKGSIEIVKYLVEIRRLSVHQLNDPRETPIYDAIKVQNFEIIKYLVEQHADINTKNEMEKTPLHFAASLGNLKIIKYLVEQNADITIEDAEGILALHAVSESNNFEAVKYLAEQKSANITHEDRNGRTILHYATRSKNFEIVKYFIERGLNVNCQDKNGRSPLHYAAAYGNLEVLKYLVEQNADINIKDKDQKTPLYYAAEKGKIKSIIYLLKKAQAAEKDSSIQNQLEQNILNIINNNFKKIENNAQSSKDFTEAYIYFKLFQIHKDITKIPRIADRIIIKKILEAQGLETLSLRELAYLYWGNTSNLKLHKIFNTLDHIILGHMLDRAQKYNQIYFKNIYNKISELYNIPKDVEQHIASYQNELTQPQAIELVLAKVKEYNERNFPEYLKSHKLYSLKELNNQLTKLNQKATKDLTFSRWILSFITRIPEYKDYNKLRDYVTVRKSLEPALKNKISPRIIDSINYHSKDDFENPVHCNLYSSKLGKYINDNLKQKIIVSSRNLQIADNIAANYNFVNRVIYKLWTRGRHLHKLGNMLINETVSSSEYQNVLQDNINEVLGYKEIETKHSNLRFSRYGKATFSSKKLSYTNWNAYRNASWSEWLQSFISKDVKVYEQYNNIKDHRKAANDIEQNSKNILSSKIEKFLRKLVDEFEFPSSFKICGANISYPICDSISLEKLYKKINTKDSGWIESLQLQSGLWNQNDIINQRYKKAATSIAKAIKKDDSFQTTWQDYVFYKADQKVNNMKLAK